MKEDTQHAKKGIKKALLTWLNPLIIVLSAVNASMSGVVNLAHLISQQIGLASVLLGNVGTSVFFNAISLALNTHSLVNHFREKNLYKRFNKTLEAKKKEKHKLQGICLDILCDMLFLIGAAASIALFGNPIALAVTAPFITLGCIVMVGSIVKSTYHQVQRFNQLSEGEKKELNKEMQEGINSSRLYKVMEKVVPSTIVLALLYDNKENKKERKEIKNLKRMLKEDINHPAFSEAAGVTNNKNDNTTSLPKKKSEEKNTETIPDHGSEGTFTQLSNPEVPSSQLSLDGGLTAARDRRNTL